MEDRILQGAKKTKQNNNTVKEIMNEILNMLWKNTGYHKGVTLSHRTIPYVLNVCEIPKINKDEKKNHKSLRSTVSDIKSIP